MSSNELKSRGYTIGAAYRLLKKVTQPQRGIASGAVRSDRLKSEPDPRSEGGLEREAEAPNAGESGLRPLMLPAGMHARLS